jgi:pimeloyl-ACP methyl ester carboxylesterase
MGGMISFQLMADHPSLVKAAALINTTPNFPLDSISIRFQVWLRLFIINIFGLKKLAGVLAKKLFPYPHQESLRQGLRHRISSNDPVSYQFAMRAIPGWSSFPKVQDAKMPKLIIAGDRDYTPLQHKKDYMQKLQNSSLEVVRDSGHASPLDQPEAINRLLESFIKEHA